MAQKRMMIKIAFSSIDYSFGVENEGTKLLKKEEKFKYVAKTKTVFIIFLTNVLLLIFLLFSMLFKSPPHLHSLRDIWLCQICSETREMWKKTGAWFYKSLPSYEKPQKLTTPRSASLTNPSRTERSRNRGIKVTDSSSDEYDEDNPSNEAGASVRSSSISAKRSSSYFLERMNSLRSRPSNSTSSLNDDGFFYRKLSSLNLFGRSPSTSKCDTESNGQYPDTSSSSVNESIYNVSTCNGSSNRRDSEPSTSVSETSSMNDKDCMGIMAMNSISSQICREQPMGWLDISLVYSESEHTLDCFLLRARDLPVVEITCPPDPYARLNIVTSFDKLKQKKWLQTRTIHKNRCPEFNETVRFFGVEPEELATSRLYVVLLDEDKYGSDFLGTAKIPLGPVSVESTLLKLFGSIISFFLQLI